MLRPRVAAAGAVAWMLVSLAACYSFNPSEGAQCQIRCDGQTCPSGLVCTASGVCGATEDSCGSADIDASVVDAAPAPDAMPPEPTGFLEIGTGSEHACGIGPDRQVYCWGSDALGQLIATAALGTGYSRTPVRVRVDPGEPAGSRWHGLSVGRNHTCALRSAASVDTLWCWGSNFTGQVGAGSDQVAAQVPDQSGRAWTSVAAGADFTCGLNAGGEVWCWGDNQVGQHGDTTFNSNVRNAPTQVAMPPAVSVAQVVAGDRFACVRASDGAAYCWGANDRRQTSPANTTCGAAACSVSPQLVGGDFVHIAAGGANGCGAEATGLRCWGDGAAFMDGASASGTNSTTPWNVVGSAAVSFSRVDVATNRACAVRSDGQIHCWGGTQNEFGQRGLSIQHPAETLPRPPAPVESLVGFAVAVSSEFTCAIDGTDPRVGGTPTCWGRNHRGQIGDGSVARIDTPTLVDGPAGGGGSWHEVAAGRDFTCAIYGGIEATRRVYCWGRNGSRQATGAIGAIDVNRVGAPIQYLAADITQARDLAVGRSHACVISGAENLNARVYCWGDDNAGQQGLAGAATTAVEVGLVPGAGNTFRDLVAGGDQTCVMTDNLSTLVKTWSCWGTGVFDSTGSYPMTNTPAVVSDLAGKERVSVGDRFLCYGDNGTDQIQCKGLNTVGQLGRGTTSTNTVSPTPYGPVMLGDVQSDPIMSVGTSSSRCVGYFSTGGDEYECWGENNRGQAGTVSTTNPLSTPGSVAVDAHLSVQRGALVTGQNHSCAILEDQQSNALRCWGSNEFGQLGVPAAGPQTHVPQAIVGPWSFVAAGGAHTCAISGSGAELRCWGNNEYGQLGTGNSNRLLPSEVTPP